jgi:hypothetical protein
MTFTGETIGNRLFRAYPLCRLQCSFIVGCICLALSGCQSPPSQSLQDGPLRFTDLSDVTHPTPLDGSLILSAAGNEWIDFAVEVDVSNQDSATLHIALPKELRAQPIAYQVLPLPMDLNRAAYVRQTGGDARTVTTPEALIPLSGEDGDFDLSSLAKRSPKNAGLVWIEMHVPAGTAAGAYEVSCQLLTANERAIASLPVRINVYPFNLPETPRLQIAGEVDWDALRAMYPAEFDGVTPQLLNRHDAALAPAIHRIDQLMSMAHDNRLQVIIPRLQPTVKWPPGSDPQIDWSDFDEVITPWLNGTAFTDHVAVNYWPPPSVDYLDNFGPASQAKYRELSAGHFDRKGWIDRRTAVLRTGPSTQPVSDDPVVLATNSSDVRNWAWSAFAQNDTTIVWNDALPNGTSINTPLDADKLIWFLPGSWFGVDQPVATVQLKWLRQAEQDYEYLKLAGQGGDEPAMKIAKMLTRPVNMQFADKPDPTCDLFTGASDPRAWANARQLLADRILQHQGNAQSPSPNQSTDPPSTRWQWSQQQPGLLIRSIQWTRSDDPNPPGQNWITARVGVDLYNPSDQVSNSNQLLWGELPQGWNATAQPVIIPSPAQYQVQRIIITGRFDLNQITAASREPMELMYIDGFSQQAFPCRSVLPVAVSQRRQRKLTIDASLNEWIAADAIQLESPLVKMLNRPAVQSHEIEPATTKSSLFSAWSDDQFYLAFRLNGITPTDLHSTHNFVDYQSRRAWGEDLCEVLIQPIYSDDTTGPTLHIVCKPGGQWVERSDADHRSDETWQAFEGAGTRYASNVDPATQIWRGELAIPWSAIIGPGHDRPALLRFNFVQHQNSTGQGASWAGPIDFGRDDAMMGLIQLREADVTGVAGSGQP